MENESMISTIYKPINTLYSANFTCLRIQHQDWSYEQEHKNNVYTRKDVFERKTIGNFWVDRKLKDAANNRNLMLANLREHFGPNDPEIFKFKQAFQDIKDTLLQIYNIWYDQNKTFDQLFDGFICKDKEFAKLIFDYETNSVFASPHIEVMHLMAAYQNYVDTLVKFMTIQAFGEITHALEMDVTEHGTPSLFYGKGYNARVLEEITNDKLQKYFDKATAIKKRIIEETNARNKDVVTLCKIKRKPNRYRNVNVADLTEQIDTLRKELFDLITVANRCESLLLLIKELDKRFISANTNYESCKSNDFCENMLDFLSGVKPSNTKDGYCVKSVYVSKLELNCLEYMFDLLRNYTPEQTKTGEKQAQPNA